MLARDGVQVGFAQYARPNRIPPAASASRAGVETNGLIEPKADQCCWSEVMRRMFGRNLRPQKRRRRRRITTNPVSEAASRTQVDGSGIVDTVCQESPIRSASKLVVPAVKPEN